MAKPAFTETTEYKIEVLNSGVLEIRRTDKVFKDGQPAGQNYTRYTLTPGEDVSGQIQRIKDVAEAVWTPDVTAAFAD